MNRDQKQLYIIAMSLTAVVLITYFVTVCVTRVVEAKAAAAHGLMNAMNPKQ